MAALAAAYFIGLPAGLIGGAVLGRRLARRWLPSNWDTAHDATAPAGSRAPDGVASRIIAARHTTADARHM
jgi:hypothetical protein